jgi:hypothetical protein
MTLFRFILGVWGRCGIQDGGVEKCEARGRRVVKVSVNDGLWFMRFLGWQRLVVGRSEN